MTDIVDKLRLDRAAMEIKQIWALLRRKSKGGGTGSIETVTLTLAGGSGGTATSAANFTYSFATADGITHTAITPTHQRLNAAKKATIGWWDSVRQALVWTDEIPDPGGCN